MLFDTDVLIWAQRGNIKAAHVISKEGERIISIVTYMELLQNAQNKKQHNIIKDFLKEFNFTTISLSENIGHRAAIYIEEYGISSGLRVGDAIIAATAVENNYTLISANQKHFRIIKELNLKVFKV